MVKASSVGWLVDRPSVLLHVVDDLPVPWNAKERAVCADVLALIVTRQTPWRWERYHIGPTDPTVSMLLVDPNANRHDFCGLSVRTNAADWPRVFFLCLTNVGVRDWEPNQYFARGDFIISQASRLGQDVVKEVRAWKRRGLAW